MDNRPVERSSLRRRCTRDNSSRCSKSCDSESDDGSATSTPGRTCRNRRRSGMDAAGSPNTDGGGRGTPRSSTPGPPVRSRSRGISLDGTSSPGVARARSSPRPIHRRPSESIPVSCVGGDTPPVIAAVPLPTRCDHALYMGEDQTVRGAIRSADGGIGKTWRDRRNPPDWRRREKTSGRNESNAVARSGASSGSREAESRAAANRINGPAASNPAADWGSTALAAARNFPKTSRSNVGTRSPKPAGEWQSRLPPGKGVESTCICSRIWSRPWWALPRDVTCSRGRAGGAVPSERTTVGSSCAAPCKS